MKNFIIMSLFVFGTQAYAGYTCQLTTYKNEFEQKNKFGETYVEEARNLIHQNGTYAIKDQNATNGLKVFYRISTTDENKAKNLIVKHKAEYQFFNSSDLDLMVATVEMEGDDFKTVKIDEYDVNIECKSIPMDDDYVQLGSGSWIIRKNADLFSSTLNH